MTSLTSWKSLIHKPHSQTPLPSPQRNVPAFSGPVKCGEADCDGETVEVPSTDSDALPVSINSTVYVDLPTSCSGDIKFLQSIETDGEQSESKQKRHVLLPVYSQQTQHVGADVRLLEQMTLAGSDTHVKVKAEKTEFG
ncbi:hypothetical protein LSAT2_018623 [Lamellibrachia satsuma]|nr:hypothetical protein LSAT2_018623 [Lamellibrachia satsuma]